MYSFGVIGAGAVTAGRYVPALVENRDASLEWVVDVDRERARQVAAGTGARHATDHAAVVDEVDAVILATPPRYHEPIARDCLSAGVAVLTEKPVATTSEQARELVELSADHHVDYAISRQYREAPACRLLQALCARGTIGQVTSISATFGDTTDWEFASTYRVDPELAGGGVLTDKGPHILDVVRWILGEDLAVESYADDSYGGLEANAELAFTGRESPVTGHVEITASRAIQNAIEIAGTRGTLRGEPGGTAVSLRTDSLGEEVTVRTTRPDSPTTSTERMARQVDRFVASLDGEVSYVPAEAGVHILEVVEDCYANRQQLDQPWEQSVLPGRGVS